MLTYCIQWGMIYMEDYVMDIVRVFAGNLRKYRKEKGLSQEKFAEMTGLHRTYISAIERKKRSIALENVQKIADALEIDTYLLFIQSNENLESGGRKEAKDESRKRL